MGEKVIKKVKTILMIVFLVLGAYFVFYEPNPESVVYVCDGPYVEVYHRTKSCKGLTKCSGQIMEINKKDIPEYLRECKICYKHNRK